MRTSRILSSPCRQRCIAGGGGSRPFRKPTMSELIREALRAYKAVRLRTEQRQQLKSKSTARRPERSK